MNDIEFRTNLPDFRAQLRAIGNDFQRRAVRSATGAAATVFKQIVIARAPVLKPENRRVGRITGTLKRNVIVTRSRRLSGNGVEVYTVTVREGKKSKFVDAFYWRFLEGGWIPRGPGKRIFGGKRRRAIERKRLGSGRVEYPFIAPAFAAGHDAALAAFNARIAKKIHEYSRDIVGS